MSDLYTRFMEWIMPFLQANWQLFLIAVGALFLLAAFLIGNGPGIPTDITCLGGMRLFTGILEKKAPGSTLAFQA